ncbi:hypothetical protein ACFQE1_02775 [Halobium palmae]|uniref:Uncharacterized protein n=1 Tax=Halobium palmae TaxID=1776492 RepID=A0ABD5RVR0_9EURY
MEQWHGDAVATPAYDSLGVRSTSIHHSKASHETGVLTLASKLATTVDAAGSAPPVSTTESVTHD